MQLSNTYSTSTTNPLITRSVCQLNKSKVVVLIPHYNNLQGLQKSLQSIYHSSGLDVLVIDDGSNKDNLPDTNKIREIANNNITVKFIYLSKNRGIANALNVGLKEIVTLNQYEFIARLDCGDTCVKNRFKIQEDFLTKNNDHSLVGSWVQWMCNKTDKVLFTFKPPVSHKKIKNRMSIRCNLIHPSVMYKLSVVKEIGHYPVNYRAAEDYAYFFKIAKHSKVANIPKFLTTTEHNTNGITNKDKKSQNKSKLKVVLKHGRKDLFLLYGVLYNFALILTPNQLVQKIKLQLK